MKLLWLLFVIGCALAAPKAKEYAADACKDDVCISPDCRCSSTNIPGGLDKSEIPQVSIAFHSHNHS